MKKVIEGKIPAKLWLDDIEEGALKQIHNLQNLPFAFKHVAIMPDSHQGYGMPIGGVLATKGVVIPNAVGVDIGCGICAFRSSLKEIKTETLKEIMGEIRNAIPVGFNHQKEQQDRSLMPACEAGNICTSEYENALTQIGTLGGGNHFIEIQKGSDGNIWVMVHSGSRNLGKKVADAYNNTAVALNESWHSSVPKEHQLAFLPLNSQEACEYVKDMFYCVEFAKANRRLMANRIMGIFIQKTGCIFNDYVETPHNYARLENHFGHNVVVHRKGATSAKLGERGLIAGSQGTKSYIVRGKGNPESFTSCSHGAGRKMSRSQAEKTLSLEGEIKRLEDKGILHAIRGVRDLDEAAGAYKDIDVVMSNQTDLVEIEVELTPLGVIKG